MAYTLSNLQTDIRNYTEVDSTVLSDSVLDTIIKNGENRIYRDADSDDNRFYATSTLVTGNRYVTIPSDLRSIRYVQLKDTNVTPNVQTFLEKKTLVIWQLTTILLQHNQEFLSIMLIGMLIFGL